MKLYVEYFKNETGMNGINFINKVFFDSVVSEKKDG